MTGTYSLCAIVLMSLADGSFAQDVSRCSTWVQDLDSENNLDTSVTLWEKINCPLIDCAMRCNQDLSCLSYFHSPSLQICLGTKSYKRRLPSSKTIDQEWQYYTIIFPIYRTTVLNGDYVLSQSLGLCYKLHEEGKTFNDAMTACEAEGAKLMVLRNQNELNFIKAAISIKMGAETNVYIGIRAIGENRDWKLFNGQNGTYLPWSVEEPNNLNGDQSCVILCNTKYCDDPCSRIRPFFCQRFIM